jgi:hypothetical protein
MLTDDRISKWVERAGAIADQNNFDLQQALELSREIRNAGVGIGVLAPATVAVLAIEQALEPRRTEEKLAHAMNAFDSLRVALLKLL